MKHYMITGGAGFIGNNLARKISSNGDKVTILDDLSAGSLNNLEGISVNFIEGSVTDFDLLVESCESVDGIFHLAAVVSVQSCMNDPIYSQDVNLRGTMNAFQASNVLGGIPVVYASSSAVYGDQGINKCDEFDTIPKPISSYGADKLGCEHQARVFFKIREVPSVGLRFFNVYGKNQPANSPYSGVIAKFISNIKSSNEHIVYGDGDQTRDFIHVSDIAEALKNSMVYISQDRECVVSNVCTGDSISINELIEILDDHAGSKNNVVYKEARDGDIRHSCGCNKFMNEILELDQVQDIKCCLPTLLS